MPRVPVRELVDLERLARDGRPPSAHQIRAALPAGWVLDADGETARRDLRLMAREGWVLLLGLVCFGAAGIGFLWDALPGGWSGLVRVALLIALVLFAGGIAGPIVSRALVRRRPAGRR